MESIYRTPLCDADDLRVIAQIEELRDGLSAHIRDPRRWVGGLRRMSLARNVQASNSIEGYHATIDDVLLALDGEQQLEGDTETQLAVAGYRDAMTYVLQVAADPSTRLDTGMLRALHFMMLRHDLNKGPGVWRPGAVHVRHTETGATVYEGPDSDRVPGLVDTLLTSIEHADAHVLVRAAMAHLNLVMIHPYRDGNGRMGRCLQTLVLARDGISHPVFSSIEEYLGRNTRDYYEVLATVGQGSWHPDNDARPWLRFCLTAHFRQARMMLHRFQESDELWGECMRLTSRHRLPERVVGGLWDAALGQRIRRAGYIQLVGLTAGETISQQAAGRDLKDMVTAGLLVPQGATRARFYTASSDLAGLRTRIRGARAADSADDPYD